MYKKMREKLFRALRYARSFRVVGTKRERWSFTSIFFWLWRAPLLDPCLLVKTSYSYSVDKVDSRSVKLSTYQLNSLAPLAFFCFCLFPVSAQSHSCMFRSFCVLREYLSREMSETRKQFSQSEHNVRGWWRTRIFRGKLFPQNDVKQINYATKREHVSLAIYIKRLTFRLVSSRKKKFFAINYFL